ncbi:MAG TPA: M48 family metalloprotease [Candidatus Elarobacter sp.]|nr:M48 family metalloprotease [Candidatus Elarobacter sp.]
MFGATFARKAALGAATGFVLGYAALRAAQAVRDLLRPYPARAHPDPKRYAADSRALMLIDGARGVAAVAATAFLVADPLDRALRPLPRPLRAPAFALILLGADALRELGCAYVEGHLRERTYGTTRQSAGGWLADQAKALGVGAVVTALLTALADAIVVRAPRRWPLIAIAATPPLLAFATIVAPTFVMPLFNAYEPLTGELEARIRELAARYGARNASILRFDMSRQTTKANAFVTGVLGTERIVLADTLLEAFPDDETMFVVAHELGHYVRRDPWIGIALGTVLLSVTLLGADALLRATTRRGLESPAQGARLAFYATLLQLALVPLGNAASRAIERRADRFALSATQDAGAGTRALTRLGERNLADFDPPRWAELLFGSHPSLRSRIRDLEAAGATPS